MLPRADHAEKWIVGHMLSSGELPAVSAEECFLPHVSEILALANDLHGQGVEPTVVNIWDELEKRGRSSEVCGVEGLGTLVQLMNDRPDVLHLTDWSAAIRAAYMRREAVLRVREAGEKLNDGGDIAGAIEVIEELRGGLKRSGTTTHGLEVLKMGAVEPERIEWLWPGRIARGKVTMLIGDPGHAKSMATCDFAARVSTGKPWPDGFPGGRPASVVMLNAEDDPADTIRPRLDAAGADVQRIWLIGSMLTVNEVGKGRRKKLLSLKEDIQRIDSALEDIGDCSLIVIDPISAYCGGTDSHNNQSVREMLTPLKELAERRRVAVLVISHLNKGGGTKSTYRSTGSLAFTAAARTVLLIAPDVDDPQRKLLLQGKTNIAKRMPGLAYRIEETMAEVPYLAWEADPVEMDADGYLALESAKASRNPDEDSALSDAVEFVRDQLASGPVLSVDLDQAARVHGISGRTLKRARKQAGAKPSKCRETGKWLVSISDGTDGPDGIVGTLGTVGPLGTLQEGQQCQGGQGSQQCQTGGEDGPIDPW